MASLITRLRHRGKSSTLPLEVSLQHTTTPTPPTPPTPSTVPLVAQKIHPNLDVLAAELVSTPPPHSHSSSNITHANPNALTPHRHPSKRSVLITTAETRRSRQDLGASTPDSPPSARVKSPHIFQRTSRLSTGSPSASLPSTPDQDAYRPGSKKRFARGLALAEFGGTEGPSRLGSSEGERDEALSSPTTSASRGYSRQRDSRSTGTSSSQGNSRPGSRSKPAGRPQSAFMTRLSSDITTTLTNAATNSDATHSRSVSETTSHYESAVASLRSSVRNFETLPEAQPEPQISPPNTPGPSRARHAETPNTFGFASPSTSNSTSMSTGHAPRPPLPPLDGLNFAIQLGGLPIRRRSHSVGSGSRWSLRKKRSKSSSAKESVDDTPRSREYHASESSQTTFQSPHTSSTKASKRQGRSWSRSKAQRSRSQSSRRVSAELSARQATAGVNWEADVVHEVLRFLEPSQIVMSDIRDNHRPGPEDASPSSFPIGDNLSYTQSRAHIYQQSPIDNTGISATTPQSPSRRKDKGKGKDMQPGSQNTVTFTDHDREGNATSGSSRAAQSSSSRASGSVGRKSSPPKSALRPQVATSTSLLQPPTLELTLPTPDGSPGRRSASDPSAPPLQSALKIPGQLSRSNTSGSKGKRKADDVEVTPPKEREAGRAKFATEPRSHRASANSGSSHAPSSYHRKRARLSISENDREGNFSTISSRSSSANPQTPSRAASRSSARATSSRSNPGPPHRHGPRRSMSEISQTSIPISALISPHAPSISQYSTTFHMRDPKRPPKPFETPWSLRFPTPGEPGSGSPIHAWMFFIGFIIFPLWWFASFWRIPRTRKMGGTDVEKAVVLDDPQVEFDAKSWRFRCRIMTGISFFTYIPFIVLVAIFAR